eukprot:jgi/Mesvir1/26860/Mv26595-RA.1
MHRHGIGGGKPSWATGPGTSDTGPRRTIAQKLEIYRLTCSVEPIGPRLGPPELYTLKPGDPEDDMQVEHITQGYRERVEGLEEAAELSLTLVHGGGLAPTATPQSPMQPADMVAATPYYWTPALVAHQRAVFRRLFQRLKRAKERQRRAGQVCGVLQMPARGPPFTFPEQKTCGEEFRLRWMQDLSQGRPLRQLADPVPHGFKRRSLLDALATHRVPLLRATWFVRVVYLNQHAPAGGGAGAERQLAERCAGWTRHALEYLDALLAEMVKDLAILKEFTLVGKDTALAAKESGGDKEGILAKDAGGSGNNSTGNGSSGSKLEEVTHVLKGRRQLLEMSFPWLPSATYPSQGHITHDDTSNLGDGGKPLESLGGGGGSQPGGAKPFSPTPTPDASATTLPAQSAYDRWRYVVSLLRWHAAESLLDVHLAVSWLLLRLAPSLAPSLATACGGNPAMQLPSPLPAPPPVGGSGQGADGSSSSNTNPNGSNSSNAGGLSLPSPAQLLAMEALFPLVLVFAEATTTSTPHLQVLAELCFQWGGYAAAATNLAEAWRGKGADASGRSRVRSGRGHYSNDAFYAIIPGEGAAEASAGFGATRDGGGGSTSPGLAVDGMPAAPAWVSPLLLGRAMMDLLRAVTVAMPEALLGVGKSLPWRLLLGGAEGQGDANEEEEQGSGGYQVTGSIAMGGKGGAGTPSMVAVLAPSSTVSGGLEGEGVARAEGRASAWGGSLESRLLAGGHGTGRSAAVLVHERACVDDTRGGGMRGMAVGDSDPAHMLEDGSDDEGTADSEGDDEDDEDDDASLRHAVSWLRDTLAARGRAANPVCMQQEASTGAAPGSSHGIGTGGAVTGGSAVAKWEALEAALVTGAIEEAAAAVFDGVPCDSCDAATHGTVCHPGDAAVIIHNNVNPINPIDINSGQPLGQNHESQQGKVHAHGDAGSVQALLWAPGGVLPSPSIPPPASGRAYAVPQPQACLRASTGGDPTTYASSVASHAHTRQEPLLHAPSLPGWDLPRPDGHTGTAVSPPPAPAPLSSEGIDAVHLSSEDVDGIHLVCEWAVRCRCLPTPSQGPWAALFPGGACAGMVGLGQEGGLAGPPPPPACDGVYPLASHRPALAVSILRVIRDKLADVCLAAVASRSNDNAADATKQNDATGGVASLASAPVPGPASRPASEPLSAPFSGPAMSKPGHGHVAIGLASGAVDVDIGSVRGRAVSVAGDRIHSVIIAWLWARTAAWAPNLFPSTTSMAGHASSHSSVAQVIHKHDPVHESATHGPSPSISPSHAAKVPLASFPPFMASPLLLTSSPSELAAAVVSAASAAASQACEDASVVRLLLQLTEEGLFRPLDYALKLVARGTLERGGGGEGADAQRHRNYLVHMAAPTAPWLPPADTEGSTSLVPSQGGTPLSLQGGGDEAPVNGSIHFQSHGRSHPFQSYAAEGGSPWQRSHGSLRKAGLAPGDRHASSVNAGIAAATAALFERERRALLKGRRRGGGGIAGNAQGAGGGARAGTLGTSVTPSHGGDEGEDTQEPVIACDRGGDGDDRHGGTEDMDYWHTEGMSDRPEPAATADDGGAALFWGQLELAGHGAGPYPGRPGTLLIPGVRAGGESGVAGPPAGGRGDRASAQREGADGSSLGCVGEGAQGGDIVVVSPVGVVAEGDGEEGGTAMESPDSDAAAPGALSSGQGGGGDGGGKQTGGAKRGASTAAISEHATASQAHATASQAPGGHPANTAGNAVAPPVAGKRKRRRGASPAPVPAASDGGDAAGHGGRDDSCEDDDGSEDAGGGRGGSPGAQSARTDHPGGQGSPHGDGDAGHGGEGGPGGGTTATRIVATRPRAGAPRHSPLRAARWVVVVPGRGARPALRHCWVWPWVMLLQRPPRGVGQMPAARMLRGGQRALPAARTRVAAATRRG